MSVVAAPPLIGRAASVSVLDLRGPGTWITDADGGEACFTVRGLCVASLCKGRASQVTTQPSWSEKRDVFSVKRESRGCWHKERRAER